MANATQQLIELVRAANGDCTDYRIAQLFDVSRSALSNYKLGLNHMSPANIVKACNLAGETNVARWQVFIGAEREVGPDGDWYRDLRTDMQRAEAGEKPAKGSMLSVFLRGVHARAITVILSAALVLGLSSFTPENTAFAASSGAGAVRQECILCNTKDKVPKNPAGSAAWVLPNWAANHSVSPAPYHRNRNSPILLHMAGRPLYWGNWSLGDRSSMRLP